MNIFVVLATLACATAFIVHTFVGSRYAVEPLLASQSLPRASKWLNYLCWHIATAHLFIMTCCLAAAVAGLAGREAVLITAVLAASISIVSVAVTLKANIAPWRFPASYLLGTVAVLSLAVLLKGVPA